MSQPEARQRAEPAPGVDPLTVPRRGERITGVLTTGIYCVAGCKARKPRPENVRFFATPAAARAAGLRPCLRCRPDEAWAGRDLDRERLQALVAAVRRDPAAYPDPSALAGAGLGATKLHALFRRHHHTTPAAFLAAARLAHAAAALAAGTGVADAAFAAGFASLSTFHERFRRAWAMTPGDYRALGTSDRFVLSIPSDYLPWPTLRAWGRDPQSVTERLAGRDIVRAFRTAEGHAARLFLRADLSPEARAAGLEGLGRGQLRALECRVEARGPLSPATLRAAHRVALRTLGIALDPAPFERRLAGAAGSDDEPGERLIAGRRGLRIPLTADPFEALVWAVLGQQVNLAFAFALRRRLVELAGDPAGDGLYAHPTPEALAAVDPADLLRRQLSRSKASWIVELSQAVASGELPLDALADATTGEIESALVARRGIGTWTAQYVLLRGYGLADCLPVGDAGLALALQRFHGLEERPDVEATRRLMAPYAPYRSLATFHLWMSLVDGEPLPAAADPLDRPEGA